MNTKELKFIESKIKGKSNTQAAIDATGTTDKAVAAVQGHRLANKPEVQSALQKALSKHSITIDRALQPITDALEATKQNNFTGEITIDHAVRLAASDRALKLLNTISKQPETPATIDNKELLQAIQDGNIQELQRIVFKQDT